MVPLAHVGGLPVEEVLPLALAGGPVWVAGVLALVARATVRRRAKP
jgi:hypothetical protein